MIKNGEWRRPWEHVYCAMKQMISVSPPMASYLHRIVVVADVRVAVRSLIAAHMNPLGRRPFHPLNDRARIVQAVWVGRAVGMHTEEQKRVTFPRLHCAHKNTVYDSCKSTSMWCNALNTAYDVAAMYSTV